MQVESHVRRDFCIYAFLAILTIAVFLPVGRHDFVNYDDQLYLTGNRIVQQGLTNEGIHWAFERLTGNGTYWHPITWLSHMLDCQLFGMNPGKQHLVSLAFHVFNVLLLFALLKRLTAAPWRSAMVSLLFAIHPLQVDSVAWLAERKNLLSTFFGFAAVWFYVVHVQDRYKRRWWTYALSLLAFGCALMCKPFVTLPCLLLLLDWWPLNRFPSRIPTGTGADAVRPLSPTIPALLFEKLPFFALAVVSGTITILGHRKLDLITATQQLPLGPRLANSVVAYWSYVRKVFWPNDLAVYYPLPLAWPPLVVLLAAAFVVGLCVLAFWFVRKSPPVFVGWFWFFGTLLPVIGLVQVNDQAMADRFVYVPLIGLFIALVWSAAGLKLFASRGVVGAAAGIVTAILVWASSLQVSYWKDSESLFNHALKVTKNNNIAHINLGEALEKQGRLPEAKAHYEQALTIQPANSIAESNLGVILAKMGSFNQAMGHFMRATNINPENADAHSNLGLALVYSGRATNAVLELNEALRLKPDHAQAQHNLANALSQLGRYEDAIPHFKEAVRLQPDNYEAANNLGYTLYKMGDYSAAEEEFRRILQSHPGFAQAQFNLGNTLIKEAKPNEALDHYAAAVKADPTLAEAQFQLGALLNETDKRADALPHLREALRLRPEWKSKIEPMLQ